ncbi:MAG: FAD-binding oxidoreductase [Anaerolineae bacterium]|nr:FAD-binding oxidoreductase [Anaerolineae bacterium]
MTVSIWQADGTQPIREVDVLIVGAGIIGVTAAYFFKQAGREVVITEMRDLALGASSRNAGFLITGLDTYYHHAIEKYGHAVVRELWNLSLQTHGYWRQFIKQSNGAVLTETCGSLLLAESEEEARELEIAARTMQQDKLEVEFLTSDPLNRGYCAAIRQSWDGAVHPYQLVRAIYEQSGAELIANNEVYAITQPDQHSVTVATRQYIFKARTVLLCTNAYSCNLDPYFVGKVIPTRAQVLATAPLKESLLDCCGYSDYGYMYYRMTFDNRLLIGGARHHHRDLENDTMDDRISDPVQRSLERYLRERFPEAADAPIDRRWAGIMGFSVDGIPLVGTLPDKPRVGFAVGLTGHGLATGAVTAERAVELLLNGTSPGALDARRLG